MPERAKRTAGTQDEKNTGRTRTTTRKKRKKSKKPLFVLIAAAVIILALVFFVMTCVAYFGGDKTRAKDGVTVLGHDVGGMNAEEIQNLLASENPFDSFSFIYNIEENENILSIVSDDINLAFDAQQTAQDAVDAGRESFLRAFTFKFSSKEIDPVASYDIGKFMKLAQDFSEKAGGTLKQHYFELSGENGEQVTVYSGSSGTGIDTRKMQTLLEESFIKNGGTATLEILDTSPADVNIDALCDFCKKTPVNAHYVHKDSKTLEVAKEQNGTELDRDKAKEALSGFAEGSAPVTIDLNTIAAEITRDQINDTLFADTLGSFSTRYSTANAPRATNVQLAAKYANGEILLPGEEFSYNRAVGQRTSERGFRPASVYEGSKSVDGLGGGICQVSTTIYSAVLYADLSVTERHEHSLEVHYGTLGMDATVSYGSLDFRFVNNTNYPIKVNVYASGGTVSASISGTDEHPEKKVEITTERTSFTPFGSTTVIDDSLKPGQKIEDCEGFNGAVVNTYKTIYENGQKKDTSLVHKSVYRMVDRVVRIGKDAPPPAEEGTPDEGAPADTPSAPASSEVIEGDSKTVEGIVDISEGT